MYQAKKALSAYGNFWLSRMQYEDVGVFVRGDAHMLENRNLAVHLRMIKLAIYFIATMTTVYAND